MNNKFETISYIFFIAGAFTLLPFEASEPNFFGYYSLCSFVPLSTIILWGIGGIAMYLDLVLQKKIPSTKKNQRINY